MMLTTTTIKNSEAKVQDNLRKALHISREVVEFGMLLLGFVDTEKYSDLVIKGKQKKKVKIYRINNKI